MAKVIEPLVLDSIGVLGLNRQASPSSLDPRWLTSAENIMLDDRGRITSRKGISQISTTIGSSSSNTEIIKSIGQFRNSSATELHCGAGTKIYELDTSTSPNTLTNVTGSVTTPTDGNWQFSNFNDNLYGVQADHKPIKYNGTSWTDLSITTYPSGLNATTFKPACCLGEFGRLWMGGIGTAKDVVYYSDTLIDNVFDPGGSEEVAYKSRTTCEANGKYWHPGKQKCWSGPGNASGYIDLRTVWNGDEVIAISAFMGKLVIFGKRNIVIYNNADDPWNMALDEVIEGVGCVARDSVQSLGDDIVFLSNSGVRSLQRTMVQDKMPLTDLSINVKDEVITHVINADMDQVKAQYCLCGGYYALSFPDRNIVYIFDFRGGSNQPPRVTTWNFSSSKTPKSFLSTSDGIMYIGLGHSDNEGKIAKYDSYYDVLKVDVTATYATQTPCEAAGHSWADSKCWQTQQDSYQANFKTTWLDFGQPAVAKLLKRFLAVISGGKNMDVTMSWYRDYGVEASSASFSLTPVSSGTTYLYGGSTSLYGTAKFAPTFQPQEYKIPLSKSAKVLRLEMKGTINGFKASLQNMIIWAKQGKIR